MLVDTTVADSHRYLSMYAMITLVPIAQTPLRTELPLLSECCSPVVREIIQPAEAETLASGFKALADPTRLRLISLVAAREDAEACVCELTDPVGLSQPTVSHHLKILVDAGVLTREQRGKWAYYRLVPETLNALAILIAPPAVR
jgi:ArsR family transcriptional regulator